jgi:molybdenum cofactor cytidylyltransferase
MAATVKIIPFATSAAALAAACEAAGQGAVSVAPYRPLRIGVVSTLLPGLKTSVVNKTLGVLEARLAPARARIVEERRCPHDDAALAETLRAIAPRCDVLVVFGASAITDRRDVIPAAIEAAGGRIEHFGMPVDPGNLLLIGALAGKPAIGAPGCARSPKENGFDWVLGRVLADIPITRADIQAMGVGGLLMEIESRPQPRQGDA